jgi:drug/metabolite transporter (DMT)-like permease
VYRAQLPWRVVLTLVLLAMTWGANMAFIKIAAREVAPLFMAGLRSLVASGLIYGWMRLKGIRMFPGNLNPVHGVAVGLLFGAEFALIYLGLQFTLASRSYILVYTAPFFVSLGAHWLLRDDRISAVKALGLTTAFVGVSLLFIKDAGRLSLAALPGDIMAIGGGALWAATTLYVKKYLAGKADPLQTIFYQLFFSIPLLFGLSVLFEPQPMSGFSLATAFSLFYQCVLVATVSFIFWFELIHRYPVSLLHAFTFFVPVFGVFVSGALMLREPLTGNLLAALALVCTGLILVNRQSPAGADPAPVGARPRRDR